MSRVGRGLISSDDATGAVTLPSAPDILPMSQGGTGQDTSAVTGQPELRAGTWYFPQNHVNVKAFGAVGNGVTDDTAAIVAATASSGAVFFPPGTYLCDGFTPASNSLYSGAGMGVTTLKLQTNNKNLISNWNAGSPVYDLHRITIRDMTLDGNYSTLADPLDDNTSMGVYLLYADYVAVRRVEMKNFWFDGINIFGSRYFWIENNLVVNCGDQNTYLGYYDGIAFDAGSYADVRTRGAYGTIQGNLVRNCGGGIRNNGVTAYTDSAHSYLIANNQIISPTTTGINLIDIYGKTHVHGNLIYQPGTYGIHLETTNTVGVYPYYAARDVQIVGNTVDGPDQNGVGLAGISAAAVSGLQIRGNAVYNIPAGADGIQALLAVDADGVVYRNSPKVLSNTVLGAATAKWGLQINADRGIVGDNDITGGFSGGGGINVAAGTDNTVRHNVLQGMATPLTDGGTTTKFDGNVGYTP